MDISDKELVEKIHLYFKNSGSRLCIAESCTGGLISHLLTGLPGASHFFDSSIIGYSIDSKIKLLGISKTLIRSHGVISAEVARAMARAFRKKRDTDFSLSTTGNLGPDTLEGKKAGLVYVAVDCKWETISKSKIFKGDRETIKYKAAISSMQLLIKVIERWA